MCALKPGSKWIKILTLSREHAELRVLVTVRRPSICLSVCPSRHSTAACSGFAAECRAGRTYQSTAAGAAARHACSVVLTAELTRLNTDLFYSVCTFLVVKYYCFDYATTESRVRMRDRAWTREGVNKCLFNFKKLLNYSQINVSFTYLRQIISFCCVEV